VSQVRKKGKTSSVPLQMWLAEDLPADVKQAIQRTSRLSDAQYLAIMPDVHLGEKVCVGTVLATTEALYPEAIGGDIGCGMTTVALCATMEWLDSEKTAAAVLRELHSAVPVLRHPHLSDTPELPAECAAEALTVSTLRGKALSEGRIELGTLGRGNHFLEFQADPDERIWLTVHSGSRGMGQLISKYHCQMHATPGSSLVRLDAGSDAGHNWLTDMNWAIAYADRNRRVVLENVGGLLNQEHGITADWTTLVFCNHDHIRQEEHFGKLWWVHRKGANSAAVDEPTIVAGSMGSPSYHVTGRGCAESLNSCSHGAGRRLSRTDARRQVTPAKLRDELSGVWHDTRGASKLVEEAPSAYKDIAKVMRAQKELVRITRRLTPVLCYKGV